MKIINAIHAQSVGGVDTVFCNYTQALINEGHEVALLISDNGNDNYQDFAAKIFKLKNASQIGDFINLLKIAIKFQPDVIICHSNRLMRWMKFLRFFTKIKLIKSKSIAVNHGITCKKSLNCDYIININEQISNLVVDFGFDAQKSFILPNVITVNQEYQAKTMNDIPTIAMYGRIEKRKGFDILIQACAILAQKNQDFKLKIGGFEVENNYNWQYLKKLTKNAEIYDKCEFFGIVKDKENFFKDVDIFCVPSRQEPFGLFILEGFLHSTPTISSNTDGGKLLIEDEKSGLLFANENPEDLAKKIQKLLQNKDFCKEISKNAYASLVKNFNFDLLGRKITKILNSISSGLWFCLIYLYHPNP